MSVSLRLCLPKSSHVLCKTHKYVVVLHCALVHDCVCGAWMLVMVGVTLEVRSLWKMPLLCRYCSPRAMSRARLSRTLHVRYTSLPNSCSKLPPLMYWIIETNTNTGKSSVMPSVWIPVLNCQNMKAASNIGWGKLGPGLVIINIICTILLGSTWELNVFKQPAITCGVKARPVATFKSCINKQLPSIILAFIEYI